MWPRLLGAAVLSVMLSSSMVSGADLKSEQKPDLSGGHTLYTVGYAHLDTQWRWAYPLVIREFIPNTMHFNFDLFEKYPNYIFNFSGANRYRLMKEYYPADFEKVKHYVSTGQWFPCGSSMEECDVNVPSSESIIRQVLYGNQFFKKELGKSSAEFMLPDCFGFPASLPSILAHCGIKGFSTQKLSWGSAVGIPFNVGVWEGLDGTSIIGALNANDYCGQISDDLSYNKSWLDRIDQDGKANGLFADYTYYGTGDRGGSPTEDSVKWLEKSIKSDGPVRVVSANADQLFLDIKPEQRKKLPRYKGDLLLTEHSAGSITSAAYMKRWNRMNELLADSAERASVAANWLGGLAYPQKRLNDAWTLVMGGQFHDILPGTSLPHCYELSQNDEVLAMNQFSGVLTHAVASIASGMDTKTKGQAVLVYNPLSIAREDVVEASVAFAKQPKAVKVIGANGKEVPSQIVSRGNGTVRVLFLAKAPSVGFSVYDVQSSDVDSKSNVLSVSTSSLENARYKVKLNSDGDVASIFDKSAGRELLSSPIRLAFTTENPSCYPAWNIDWNDQKNAPRSYVDGAAKIRIVENGPVRVALEVERDKEDSKFIQTIRLSDGASGNRVEFNNKINWRSKECSLKAVFPLTVSNPQATYNWEVGTIQRGNNDPKKYEVPSHQWFDLTDTKGDYGVTVLSPFKYGSDKPNDNTLRLTLLRTPGVHGDYGEQAVQDWGLHNISFGIAGHVNDWRDGQTYWQALRMEQPLIAFNSGKHSGALGKSVSMLKISNPHVRVIALKKAENSDEIIIRMVEMSGNPAKGVKITFPTQIVSAREVNGQEEPVGSARITDGTLIADFAGYRLQTYAIRLGESHIQLKRSASKSVILPYNTNVASNDGERSSGGFDKDGRALPAEMLPPAITDGNVTFNLTSATAGKVYAVTCKGQNIALPDGKFNKIVLLAASSPSDQKAAFDVDGKKVELTIQDWGGYIGKSDTRLWKGTPSELTYEWPYEYAGLVPGYIKRTPVAWFCSHRHTANGDNDIYSYSYLYRYDIDAPSGAKNLKLPDNDNIHILAVSVVNDTTRGCNPAHPLYDTLEDHTAMIKD